MDSVLFALILFPHCFNGITLLSRFASSMPILLIRLFPALAYLDAANIITSGNVLLAVTATTFLLTGHPVACAFATFFAALCDYVDGHVARTYLRDRQENREFGKQLDTLSDLLNFSAVPSIAIIVLCGVNWQTMAIALLLVLSSVLRLSHFAISSVSGGYIGIPTTYTGFVFANLLLLTSSGNLPQAWLAPVLALLALLQILNVKIRKFPAPAVIAVMALAFMVVVFFVF